MFGSIIKTCYVVQWHSLYQSSVSLCVHSVTDFVTTMLRWDQCWVDLCFNAPHTRFLSGEQLCQLNLHTYCLNHNHPHTVMLYVNLNTSPKILSSFLFLLFTLQWFSCRSLGNLMITYTCHTHTHTRQAKSLIHGNIITASVYLYGKQADAITK